MDPIEKFFLYEKEVAEFKVKLLNKLSDDKEGEIDSLSKRTSNLSVVEDVLQAVGKPMHVSEIIEAAEKEFGVTLDRDSLTSSLTKQIHKGKRFTRTAPNTFWLRAT